jgi:hypothetical protein
MSLCLLCVRNDNRELRMWVEKNGPRSKEQTKQKAKSRDTAWIKLSQLLPRERLALASYDGNPTQRGFRD